MNYMFERKAIDFRDIENQTPVIIAEDISVRRNERFILRNISLVLHQGERLGLAGPNGSGKSTLLKVLSLLIPPSSGRLTVLGFMGDGRSSVTVRRKMSIVFQQPTTLTGSVLQNVSIPLRMRGLSAREATKRAYEWLKCFDLEKLAFQRIHTLSGGELARLQLARAFAMEPEILFLDEPFAAVDATSRSPLKALLREILAKNKVSLLLISHDFRDLLDLTERTLVLLDGHIVAQGKTQTLRIQSPLVREIFPE